MFTKVAEARVPIIRQLAVDVVNQTFPRGSKMLTDVQRGGYPADRGRDATRRDTGHDLCGAG